MASDRAEPDRQLQRCDHICLKDAEHLDRGEPHFYGYEIPSPREVAERLLTEERKRGVAAFMDWLLDVKGYRIVAPTEDMPKLRTLLDEFASPVEEAEPRGVICDVPGHPNNYAHDCDGTPHPLMAPEPSPDPMRAYEHEDGTVVRGVLAKEAREAEPSPEGVITTSRAEADPMYLRGVKAACARIMLTDPAALAPVEEAEPPTLHAEPKQHVQPKRPGCWGSAAYPLPPLCSNSHCWGVDACPNAACDCTCHKAPEPSPEGAITAEDERG